MWIRSSLAALLAAALTLPALADGRPFPQQAKRGKMTPAYAPDIVIDGQMRRLTPAARIFSQDNLIEMPASLRGRDIPVNYVEDASGQIDLVWILTREEAAQPVPSAKAR
ncbi:MAG: hypothetical protein V4724_26240 [Pseudomonadota bacterium]